MKTYFLIIAIATTVTFAKANNQPYEMIIEGVKVVVQPAGNDIVEIRTIIKGGVQNYPENKAGIESLAMMALTECGTELRDKNDFKNKLDAVGAIVTGVAGKDYATFRMNCIKMDFETVWPLYVEALLQPKFDLKEFGRIKQDAINNLNARESEPDASIDKFAEKIAFAGQDYAKDPDGSATNLHSLTAVETNDYYDSVLTKSRLLMVVVADLDKESLASKLKTLLAGVKPGKPFLLRKSSFSSTKNRFTAAPKALATNYIEGITGGPAPGSKDFNAFNVAMRILSDRHFLEVREKNGLSYAPQSWFSGSATSSSRIAVSTTEPNKYITVFYSMLSKIKKDGFKDEEVKNMKTTYLTAFYRSQETNAAQAATLAASEVLHNNWRRTLTLLEDIGKLTTPEINKVFNTYIGNFSWVYHGNLNQVNTTLYTGI
ncbi:M16 family metallopeptidase [Pedobacter immunditicola]|uniref:M16 family metallopeptidase n=1 Tax=Pedobacter immunditicola TaxID=3133440 RepID=UPI0030A55377